MRGRVSVCAPLCCKTSGAKTCAVHPVLSRVVRELWSADPKRGHEPNASSGAQPEASGRSWEAGHKQQQGPENQGCQHMPNEPRGSFPKSLFDGFPLHEQHSGAKLCTPGGGGVCFEARCGRNFIPPPIYSAPTLRRLF